MEFGKTAAATSRVSNVVLGGWFVHHVIDVFESYAGQAHFFDSLSYVVGFKECFLGLSECKAAMLSENFKNVRRNCYSRDLRKRRGRTFYNSETASVELARDYGCTFSEFLS